MMHRISEAGLLLMRDFLLYLLIVNVIILAVMSLASFAFQGMVYKVHGRLFQFSELEINLLFYSFLGLYKLLIIFFNIAPLIAVQIIL